MGPSRGGPRPPLVPFFVALMIWMIYDLWSNTLFFGQLNNFLENFLRLWKVWKNQHYMNFNLALSCKSICVNVKLFIKIISCHSISIETFLQSIEKEIRMSVSKRSSVYPQNVFGICFYFLTRPRILKSLINVVLFLSLE